MVTSKLLCGLINILVMKSDNNPLNIRYCKTNKWLGQIGQNKGFVRFATLSFGVRAAIKLLINYYVKYQLDSVEKIINRYAPSVENDTEAYISFVSHRTGIPRDASLSLFDIIRSVLPAMAVFESNYKIPVGFIDQVIAYYQLNLYKYEKD